MLPWLIGAILSFATPLHATSLFLNSWGISYGNWVPTSLPLYVSEYHIVEDYIATNLSPWDTNGIYGFVDPGWGGDTFDAEALYLGLSSTNLYVAIVTGTPQGGALDPFSRGRYPTEYEPGDIALDLNNDGTYEFAITTRTDEQFAPPGTLLYDDLSWQETAFFSYLYAVSSANSQTPLGVNFSYSLFDTSFVKERIINHYAIEAVVPLSTLGLTPDDINSGGVNIRWTMECGNDVIGLNAPPGSYTMIPEPSTLLLLGTGLAGLVGVYLRRKTIKG